MTSAFIQERLQIVEGLVCPPQAGTFLEDIETGQTDPISSWLFSDVSRRDNLRIGGIGVFADTDIAEDMLIAIKGGRVVDERTIRENTATIKGTHQQIDTDLFITGLTPIEVEKTRIGYNHSCEPNAKIIVVEGVKSAFLATRRDVKSGEELTTDYAVSFDTDTQRFDPCLCGLPAGRCRGLVDPSTDWRKPELQHRYAGEFPDYMQQKIDDIH